MGLVPQPNALKSSFENLAAYPRRSFSLESSGAYGYDRDLRAVKWKTSVDRRIAMQGKRFFVVLAGASAALLWASSAHASEIQWIKSYDDATRTTRQRGTLMMLDFYTDW